MSAPSDDYSHRALSIHVTVGSVRVLLAPMLLVPVVIVALWDTCSRVGIKGTVFACSPMYPHLKPFEPAEQSACAQLMLIITGLLLTLLSLDTLKTSRPRVLLWGQHAVVIAAVCATFISELSATVHIYAELTPLLVVPETIDMPMEVAPGLDTTTCFAGSQLLPPGSTFAFTQWVLLGVTSPFILLELMSLMGFNYYWTTPTLIFLQVLSRCVSAITVVNLPPQTSTPEVHRLMAASLSVVLFSAGYAVSVWHVRWLGRLLYAELARKKEEQKNREVMMRHVFHECRQPLHCIQVAIHCASNTVTACPACNPLDLALEQSSWAAQTMARMLNDQLLQRKIADGQLNIDSSARFRLGSALRNAISAANLLALDCEVTLELKVDDQANSVILAGDGGLVEQSFMNGLANAIKFSTRGETVQMTATVNGAKTIVSIHVIDSGRGFDEQEGKQLFKPWGQAKVLCSMDSPEQTAGPATSGLGLLISRGIVEAHGGTLHLTSSGLKTGSDFAITLPIASFSSEREGGRDGSSSDSHQGSTASSYKNVELSGKDDPGASSAVWQSDPPHVRTLVVDDKMSLRRVMRYALERLNCDVTDACNGLEAVTLVLAADAADASFHLIVLDNSMPVLSGVEAARQMRKAGFEGYIVGLTGDVMLGGSELEDEDERAVFENSGVDICLTKGSREVVEIIDATVRNLQAGLAEAEALPPSE